MTEALASIIDQPLSHWPMPRTLAIRTAAVLLPLLARADAASAQWNEARFDSARVGPVAPGL
jgi:hypothetical protein